MRLSRAQSVAEYGIGVGVIIIAVVAMQAYVKRGLQGRYRDVVDTVAAKVVTANVSQRQYEPYYSNSTAQVKTNTSADYDIYHWGGWNWWNKENIREAYNVTAKQKDSLRSD
jgi:hypothetical protein